MGRSAGSSDGQSRTWRRYATLLRYVRPEAKGWLAILALTLLTTAVALLIPLPLKVLIDNVVGHHSPPAYVRILPGSADHRVLLIYVVAAELLFFALAGALDVALTFLWIKVGQKMVYTLSGDLFGRLQRRSMREHARQPVGELLERVAGDSWAVYTVADELLFTPFHAIVAIAGIAFVMLELSTELTLVACIAVPLMAVASAVLGRRVKKPGLRYRELPGGFQSHVQQTLSGLGVVQAFGAEERQQRRFRELTGAALRSQLRMAFAGGLTGLGAGVVASVGIAAVLVVGGHQVLGGALTVGGLVVFLSYVNMLQAQLGGSPDAQDQPDSSTAIQTGGLMSIYPKLQSIRGSVDRVVEVLDAPVEVVDAPGAVGLERVAGDVVFEGVWFGYEPGRPVLRGIDFVARPGEVVAVVGATGAGKSTLVSLLPRFFDPDVGRVLLDGRDLREVKLASVRRSVSLVLQESFLFPFSIAENIAFGRPGASRKEVEAAARAANAHEFISRLPDGYATVVGERGATLSGGERQRVAIARALLKDAPVLILDEPTSALDAQTESLLLDALDRLMAGRTTLIIAHRLSTIRDADQILVLEDGRIVEAGNHEHLLAQNGHYARMHRAQYRPAEVAA